MAKDQYVTENGSRTLYANIEVTPVLSLKTLLTHTGQSSKTPKSKPSHTSQHFLGNKSNGFLSPIGYTDLQRNSTEALYTKPVDIDYSSITTANLRELGEDGLNVTKNNEAVLDSSLETMSAYAVQDPVKSVFKQLDTHTSPFMDDSPSNIRLELGENDPEKVTKNNKALLYSSLKTLSIHDEIKELEQSRTTLYADSSNDFLSTTRYTEFSRKITEAPPNKNVFTTNNVPNTGLNVKTKWIHEIQNSVTPESKQPVVSHTPQYYESDSGNFFSSTFGYMDLQRNLTERLPDDHFDTVTPYKDTTTGTMANLMEQIKNNWTVTTNVEAIPVSNLKQLLTHSVQSVTPEFEQPIKTFTRTTDFKELGQNGPGYVTNKDEAVPDFTSKTLPIHAEHDTVKSEFKAEESITSPYVDSSNDFFSTIRFTNLIRNKTETASNERVVTTNIEDIPVLSLKPLSTDTVQNSATPDVKPVQSQISRYYLGNSSQDFISGYMDLERNTAKTLPIKHFNTEMTTGSMANLMKQSENGLSIVTTNIPISSLEPLLIRSVPSSETPKFKQAVKSHTSTIKYTNHHRKLTKPPSTQRIDITSTRTTNFIEHAKYGPKNVTEKDKAFTNLTLKPLSTSVIQNSLTPESKQPVLLHTSRYQVGNDFIKGTKETSTKTENDNLMPYDKPYETTIKVDSFRTHKTVDSPSETQIDNLDFISETTDKYLTNSYETAVTRKTINQYKDNFKSTPNYTNKVSNLKTVPILPKHIKSEKYNLTTLQTKDAYFTPEKPLLVEITAANVNAEHKQNKKLNSKELNLKSDKNSNVLADRYPVHTKITPLLLTTSNIAVNDNEKSGKKYGKGANFQITEADTVANIQTTMPANFDRFPAAIIEKPKTVSILDEPTITQTTFKKAVETFVHPVDNLVKSTDAVSLLEPEISNKKHTFTTGDSFLSISLDDANRKIHREKPKNRVTKDFPVYKYLNSTEAKSTSPQVIPQIIDKHVKHSLVNNNNKYQEDIIKIVTENIKELTKENDTKTTKKKEKSNEITTNKPESPTTQEFVMHTLTFDNSTLQAQNITLPPITLNRDNNHPGKVNKNGDQQADINIHTSNSNKPTEGYYRKPTSLEDKSNPKIYTHRDTTKKNKDAKDITKLPRTETVISSTSQIPVPAMKIKVTTTSFTTPSSLQTMNIINTYDKLNVNIARPLTNSTVVPYPNKPSLIQAMHTIKNTHTSMKKNNNTHEKEVAENQKKLDQSTHHFKHLTTAKMYEEQLIKNTTEFNYDQLKTQNKYSSTPLGKDLVYGYTSHINHSGSKELEISAKIVTTNKNALMSNNKTKHNTDVLSHKPNYLLNKFDFTTSNRQESTGEKNIFEELLFELTSQSYSVDFPEPRTTTENVLSKPELFFDTKSTVQKNIKTTNSENILSNDNITTTEMFDNTKQKAYTDITVSEVITPKALLLKYLAQDQTSTTDYRATAIQSNLVSENAERSTSSGESTTNNSDTESNLTELAGNIYDSAIFTKTTNPIGNTAQELSFEEENVDKIRSLTLDKITLNPNQTEVPSEGKSVFDIQADDLQINRMIEVLASTINLYSEFSGSNDALQRRRDTTQLQLDNDNTTFTMKSPSKGTKNDIPNHKIPDVLQSYYTKTMKGSVTPELYTTTVKHYQTHPIINTLTKVTNNGGKTIQTVTPNSKNYRENEIEIDDPVTVSMRTARDDDKNDFQLKSNENEVSLQSKLPILLDKTTKDDNKETQTSQQSIINAQANINHSFSKIRDHLKDIKELKIISLKENVTQTRKNANGNESSNNSEVSSGVKASDPKQSIINLNTELNQKSTESDLKFTKVNHTLNRQKGTLLGFGWSKSSTAKNKLTQIQNQTYSVSYSTLVEPSRRVYIDKIPIKRMSPNTISVNTSDNLVTIDNSENKSGNDNKELSSIKAIRKMLIIDKKESTRAQNNIKTDTFMTPAREINSETFTNKIKNSPETSTEKNIVKTHVVSHEGDNILHRIPEQNGAKNKSETLSHIDTKSRPAVNDYMKTKHRKLTNAPVEIPLTQLIVNSTSDIKSTHKKETASFVYVASPDGNTTQNDITFQTSNTNHYADKFIIDNMETKLSAVKETANGISHKDILSNSFKTSFVHTTKINDKPYITTNTARPSTRVQESYIHLSDGTTNENLLTKENVYSTEEHSQMLLESLITSLREEGNDTISIDKPSNKGQIPEESTMDMGTFKESSHTDDVIPQTNLDVKFNNLNNESWNITLNETLYPQHSKTTIATNVISQHDQSKTTPDVYYTISLKSPTAKYELGKYYINVVTETISTVHNKQYKGFTQTDHLTNEQPNHIEDRHNTGSIKTRQQDIKQFANEVIDPSNSPKSKEKLNIVIAREQYKKKQLRNNNIERNTKLKPVMKLPILNYDKFNISSNTKFTKILHDNNIQENSLEHKITIPRTNHNDYVTSFPLSNYKNGKDVKITTDGHHIVYNTYKEDSEESIIKTGLAQGNGEIVKNNQTYSTSDDKSHSNDILSILTQIMQDKPSTIKRMSLTSTVKQTTLPKATMIDPTVIDQLISYSKQSKNCSLVKMMQERLRQSFHSLNKILSHLNCSDHTPRKTTQKPPHTGTAHNKSNPKQLRSIWDTFDETHLYPIKKLTPHSQVKITKRIYKAKPSSTAPHKHPDRNKLVYPNTKLRRILDKFNKPNPMSNTRNPTRAPKVLVLRPKFSDSVFYPKSSHVKSKPLYIKATRDEIPFDDLSDRRLPNWRDRVAYISDTVKSRAMQRLPAQRTTQVQNYVMNIPYVAPEARDNPTILRNKVDSVRNYFYNLDYNMRPVPRRKFISPKELFSDHVDDSEDYPVVGTRTDWLEEQTTFTSTWHHRKKTGRKPRTIFFLSPTVPYYRYF